MFLEKACIFLYSFILNSVRMISENVFGQFNQNIHEQCNFRLENELLEPVSMA